jgi:subtilisin family serine protease
MRLCVALAVALSTLAACTCKNLGPTQGIKGVAVTERFLKVSNPIPNEYIVVLKDPPSGVPVPKVADVSANLVARYGGSSFFVYETALRGFASKMSEEQAKAMSKDPQVSYVQENNVMQISGNQADATWGLDRIDQRDLPLNKTYNYSSSGAGVNAYIIDTGIRITHREFGGRAKHAFDAVNDGQNGNDCHGHGTHVAGTVGGATFGVAKNVDLHAIRVLSCQGYGSTAGVVAGVDWVTQNRVLPAVANMSLGGGEDQALDDAVRRSIAAGVTYVLAAGNENRSACLGSPSRVAEAITVGATTDADARASFSNYGPCVDVFAPGYNITSSWVDSDSSSHTISGTSMASPHVAGLAALYLERNTSSAPAAVSAALVEGATGGKVFNPGACTTDKLAYSPAASAAPPVAAAKGRGPMMASAGCPQRAH